MTAFPGEPDDVYQQSWNFRVELGGLGPTFFSEAGPFEMEAADIDQMEGGDQLPRQSQGRVTVANINLKHGISAFFTEAGPFEMEAADIDQMEGGDQLPRQSQ